ncbi:pyocin knob domain-containing protein, partial [Variovorax sp. 2RAF20]
PTNKLYIKQMAYEFAGDRIWTRVMAGSGWTVWKQVSSDVIALATNTNVNGLKVTGTYWSTASATANNPTTNNTVYIEHTEFD